MPLNDLIAEIRQLNEAEEQLIDRLHLHEERKFNSSTTVVTDNPSVRDDDIIEINAGKLPILLGVGGNSTSDVCNKIKFFSA